MSNSLIKCQIIGCYSNHKDSQRTTSTMPVSLPKDPNKDKGGFSNLDNIIIETSEKKLFVIYLYTKYTAFSDEYIGCTTGYFSIHPIFSWDMNMCNLITHFPRSEYFVSLNARYFNPNLEQYEDFDNRINCEYFSYDFDGKNALYPCGYSYIHYDLFISRDDFFNYRKNYLSFVNGISPESEKVNTHVLRYILDDTIIRELCSMIH